jgi:hypothetical protein
MSAIQKARDWLAERDVAGNQSDQRAIAVVRDLLAHIEDCALTRSRDARIAELEQQVHDLRVMYGLQQ